MITSAEVQSWLGLKAGDSALTQVVAATNAYVASLPVVGTDPEAQWSAQVKLGAVMLASRLHRRRNSPGGVEAITDQGVAFVARYDSDVSRLLKLDGFTRPMVG